MPRAIKTGYAAYCTAAAAVFKDLFEGTAKKKEELFVAELFGLDRFESSADRRNRGWGLSKSSSGRSNRLKVFVRQWLDDEQAEEAARLESIVADTGDRIKSIKLVSDWIEKKSDLILQIARVTISPGVDEQTYNEQTKELIQSIGSIIEQVKEIRSENEEELTPAHLQLLSNIIDRVDALYDQIVQIDEIIKQDGDASAVNRGWLAFGQDVNSLGKWLEGERAPLPGEKNRASKRLNEILNREENADLALSRCVDAMMEEGSSCLWIALTVKGPSEFAVQFSSHVVPAIEEGFVKENYPQGQIRLFENEMNNTVVDLTVGTPRSEQDFKDFLYMLVKSLIFGPDFDHQHKGTVWNESGLFRESDLEDLAGDKIAISQRFNSDGSILGNTAVFHSGEIVFLGRSDAVEDYEKKLTEVLSEEEAADLGLQSKSKQVFPIPEANEGVSILHGMIVCDDGVWRYWDFSRFGTRLICEGRGKESIRTYIHHDVNELEPGCTLHLGAEERVDGEQLFTKAATLKVSFYIDYDMISAM